MTRWPRALLALAACAAPLAAQQAGEVGVGSRAPAVVIADLEGHPVDLADLFGHRPVFLEFWATWCEQCEALLPRVREAHRAYGDRVEFLGVNVTVNQTRARVERYLERHRPPFRTLWDNRGASVRAFQVATTSTVVIVDAAGTIVYTGTGGAQDFTAALRQATAADTNSSPERSP